jgi:hypothetical protein
MNCFTAEKYLPIIYVSFAFCARMLILINTISLFGFDDCIADDARCPVLFSCAPAC